jgi:iron complex transport system permease protein
MFAALLIGASPLSLGDALTALFGVGEAGARVIIWEIRLPRALAAFLVGAALGASGAALQGLLRNPLAEPGVLGVSATAALFATAAIYYGVAALFPLAMPIAAIVGALIAVAALAVFAARGANVVTLILVGVGLSSFAGALMALLLNFAPNPFALSDMVSWMLGSVANRSLRDIAFAGPFLAAGLSILWLSRRGLSALTLGEEAAAGIGLDLSRARLAIIAGAGLATGASVALAGAVGFVGIVAAHIVRPLVAHDPARTLLPAALLAGLILVVADVIVRVLPIEGELRLGVVAALIGAPAFVAIAAGWRRRDG